MAQGTDKIQQIQGVMMLLLLASPQGKLRELFNAALSASASQVETKITPLSDASEDSVKEWLQSILAQGGLTAEEQALVEWQNNSENMKGAVEELIALQDKGNFKLTLQTI